MVPRHGTKVVEAIHEPHESKSNRPSKAAEHRRTPKRWRVGYGGPEHPPGFGVRPLLRRYGFPARFMVPRHGKNADKSIDEWPFRPRPSAPSQGAGGFSVRNYSLQELAWSANVQAVKTIPHHAAALWLWLRLIAMSMFVSLPINAGNWPQWRGPQG